MSRSKKFPVFKDSHKKLYDKRLSNKKIRKASDIENFKGFNLLKKLYDPWNICDWKWYPKDIDDINKSSRK
jgi:hypothetical protein